jgi:phosphonopyruvate decarboxylase
MTEPTLHNGPRGVSSGTDNFRLIVGVPDSSLEPLSYLWREATARSVVCTSEGSAVAMAAGWALASGGCPLVYMQNSGLTNAMNPLMSLTHHSVHSVPMVLMIGMRGWLGDEPQHHVIGLTTTSLLRMVDVPYTTVTADSHNTVVHSLGDAYRSARASGAPVAVLVSRAVSQTDVPNRDGGRMNEPWTSHDAVRAVLEIADPGSILVSSTGFNTRYVSEYRKEHPDKYHEYVYCVGAMGHACSIAQGVALAKPSSRVICIDGDGSILMHLGAALMAPSLALRNYIHVIINNGCHESVGGGNTLGSTLNLSDMADERWWTTGQIRGPMTSSVAESLKVLLNANGPVLIEMYTRPTFAHAATRPTRPFAAIEPALRHGAEDHEDYG